MTKAFDTALALIQAEMAEKKIAERVEVKPAPKIATYIDSRVNIRLPVILFDKRGSGALKELIVKSSVNNYKVVIQADGLELYNKDWNWFYSMSQITKGAAALQKDSAYILSVTDLKFKSNLKISLKPVGAGVTLSEVFLKVDIAKVV